MIGVEQRDRWDSAVRETQVHDFKSGRIWGKMFHCPDTRSFPCFLFTLATLMNFCPFSQLVCWSGNSKQFYNSSLLSGIPFQLYRYLIIFVLHISLYKVAGLSVQEKIDFSIILSTSCDSVRCDLTSYDNTQCFMYTVFKRFQYLCFRSVFSWRKAARTDAA